MTDNLPALTYYGKWSSIWAVSPQPRLSPLFRRLLWGVRETKNGAHVTRVTIVYLAKEAWRNFRELRQDEVRRINLLRGWVNKVMMHLANLLAQWEIAATFRTFPANKPKTGYFFR